MEEATATHVARASVPVTVVVPTKNEELAIVECLSHLTAFEQVVVVDSQSTDATLELAAGAGAEVVTFAWDHRYPKKKQWCLDNLDLRHDWVLFVDADEVPTPELVEEIHDVVTDPRPGVSAYRVNLSYHFMGVELRHGHTVTKVVLLRHAEVHFPVLADLDVPGMGEQEGHYQPVASGQVAALAATLDHRDPGTLTEWLARHNRYSDWEAGLALDPELSRSINRLRSRQGALFARVPFKPLAFPIWSLLARSGWRDGRPGLDYAVALGFYYWTIGAKIREKKLR